MNEFEEKVPVGVEKDNIQDLFLIIKPYIENACPPTEAFLLLWSLVLTEREILKSSKFESAISLTVDLKTENILQIPAEVFAELTEPTKIARGWLHLAGYNSKRGLHDQAALNIIASFKANGKLSAKILLAASRIMSRAGFRVGALCSACLVLARNSTDGEAINLVIDGTSDFDLEDKLQVLENIYELSADQGTLLIALAGCYFNLGDKIVAKKLLENVKKRFHKNSEYKWLKLSLEEAYHDSPVRRRSLEQIAFTSDISVDRCLEIARQLFALKDFVRAEKCFLRAWTLTNLDSTRKSIINALSSFPCQLGPDRNLPLVLVSQIQRSGGTLLSQLLDGHPELLVHPHELHIGAPKKWNWPELNLTGTPSDWLTSLFEAPFPELILRGYSKPDRNSIAASKSFPFKFSLANLCSDFVERTSKLKSTTQRQILNAYFSSFFDSWKNRNETGQEKWYAGFTPRLLSNYGSLKRFWRDYPDGIVVAVIRDPCTWYASSRRHDREYEAIENAIELWRSSTLSALLQAKTDSTRFHMITYESLVQNTEENMLCLSYRLGISYNSCLLIPSFLGSPILPNSSYSIGEIGVHQRSLDTANLLSDAERSYIEKEALELYEEAKSLSDSIRLNLLEHYRSV